MADDGADADGGDAEGDADVVIVAAAVSGKSFIRAIEAEVIGDGEGSLDEGVIEADVFWEGLGVIVDEVDVLDTEGEPFLIGGALGEGFDLFDE